MLRERFLPLFSLPTFRHRYEEPSSCVLGRSLRRVEGEPTSVKPWIPFYRKGLSGVYEKTLVLVWLVRREVESRVTSYPHQW